MLFKLPLLSCLLWFTNAYASEPPKTTELPTKNVGIWSPDLGNGHYHNPILNGDYSDPDVVRVGNDFYLTSSSFNLIPGLPILHSKDLVNWEIVGYALSNLYPNEHYSVPRHGGGVWAPTIRHHNGKFMIYYADPDFGVFVTMAKSAKGPWSQPQLVDKTKGAIDPAPFWDDDGQGYLVYAYANSRSGKSNIIELKKLSNDNLSTVGKAKKIIDGNDYEKVQTSQGMKPWFTIEGPKLYKRGKYYYVFAPAGSVKGGWQGVFRATEIDGDYQAKLVIDQGETEINGPHQGAWVTTAKGEDWFIHFQDTDTYGRRVHLQPMQWHSNGWPIIGEPQKEYDFGQPVISYKKPTVDAVVKPQSPIVNDNFNDGYHLGWQWSATPRDNWVEPSNTGVLRLNSISSSENLWEAGNLLTQKLPSMKFSATTKLKMYAKKQGERAGLVVMGYGYHWIGLENTSDGIRLVRVSRKDASSFDSEEVITAPINIDGEISVKVHFEPITVAEPMPDYPSIFPAMLRSIRAKITFSYRVGDSGTYTQLGTSLIADQGRWIGTKVGLFAQATSGTPSFISTSIGYTNFYHFSITK
ncbi:MAG: glycoside hydrolase 43 family protein [Colwellia sp.]